MPAPALPGGASIGCSIRCWIGPQILQNGRRYDGQADEKHFKTMIISRLVT
jgi:hypothetical protein